MPSSVPAPIAVRSGTHAVRRPTRQALQMPHEGAHRDHYPVSGRQAVDVFADGLDDPGAFVPEHHRRRPRPFPADDVQVAAADADRRHPHKHLAGARFPGARARPFRAASPAPRKSAARFFIRAASAAERRSCAERGGDLGAGCDGGDVLHCVVERSVLPLGAGGRRPV